MNLQVLSPLDIITDVDEFGQPEFWITSAGAKIALCTSKGTAEQFLYAVKTAIEAERGKHESHCCYCDCAAKFRELARTIAASIVSATDN